MFLALTFRLNIRIVCHCNVPPRGMSEFGTSASPTACTTEILEVCLGRHLAPHNSAQKNNGGAPIGNRCQRKRLSTQPCSNEGLTGKKVFKFTNGFPKRFCAHSFAPQRKACSSGKSEIPRAKASAGCQSARGRQ